MSVNRYSDTAGELITLASGMRMWVGTKAAHEAAKQAGTLPTDCLIAITDDDDEFKTDQVIEDSQKVITSGGVYDALKYSTTETFTGQYWIDGKKIYRTVYTGTSSGSNTNIGSCADKHFIRSYGSFKPNGYDTMYPINMGDTSSYFLYCRAQYSSSINNFQLIKTGFGDGTYEIVVEYTKTTD